MGCANQGVTYGNTLVELGRQDERVAVLGANLGASAMGKLLETKFPGRRFEMGIVEANMTSMTAGLTQTRKTPLANSFAVLTGGQAYGWICRTITIGKLNVKICRSFSGLSDLGDGATRQCTEDLVISCAVSNTTIVCPVDANETAEAVEAMTTMDGPCHLRPNRNDYPNMTKEGEKFTLGISGVPEEGTDTVLFATGYMIGLVLEVATELEGGVSVKVVNVSTTKPMDAEAVKKMAEGYQVVVTTEEHDVTGKLGSVLVEVFCGNPKPMKMVEIKDTFGCSRHNYQEVLEFHGLTGATIMEVVMEMVEL